METKTYIKPKIEVVEIEVEENIMTGSLRDDLEDSSESTGGAAYSKRRNFWGQDE